MWLQMPLRVIKKLRVKSETWVQVGIWVPGSIQTWSACSTTQWRDDVWARAAAEGLVRVRGPMATRVSADVRCSCYHQRQCRLPRSRAILVFQSHTASGGSGDIQTQLLLIPMLGSMVLPRLGSELSLGPALTPVVTQRPWVGATTWGGCWCPVTTWLPEPSPS